MHSARRIPITLSAALLLGVALGLSIQRERQPSTDDAPAPVEYPTAAGRDIRSSSSRPGAETSFIRKPASSTTAAYAAAWELLKDGKLRRRDRRDLECALMRKWCLIDLRAALHAAFEEEGMDEEDPFVESPLDACAEGIVDQPDFVWDLISSREYGLHTRRLRWKWIENEAEARPLELIRRLPELPADCIHEAIRAVTAIIHFREDPTSVRDEVIDAVLVLRGTPDEAAATRGFVEGMVAARESDEIAALVADSPDPALRKLYLDAYVRSIGFLFPGQNPGGLDLLPVDVRAEVESRLGRDSPAPEGLFPVTEPEAPPPDE